MNPRKKRRNRSFDRWKQRNSLMISHMNTINDLEYIYYSQIRRSNTKHKLLRAAAHLAINYNYCDESFFMRRMKMDYALAHSICRELLRLGIVDMMGTRHYHTIVKHYEADQIFINPNPLTL